ncbi:hypothetical protein PM082_004453 [Marasmius tenuissimus]|nr:hypothetical protein PM082_004453 [Marasmius tenuissimus]
MTTASARRFTVVIATQLITGSHKTNLTGLGSSFQHYCFRNRSPRAPNLSP